MARNGIGYLGSMPAGRVVDDDHTDRIQRFRWKLGGHGDAARLHWDDGTIRYIRQPSFTPQSTVPPSRLGLASPRAVASELTRFPSRRDDYPVVIAHIRDGDDIVKHIPEYPVRFVFERMVEASARVNQDHVRPVHEAGEVVGEDEDGATRARTITPPICWAILSWRCWVRASWTGSRVIGRA